MHRRRAPAAAALLLAAAGAIPSAAQAPAPELLWLRDNTSREGTVLQVTADSVTIRSQGSEITLPLKDLRPDSAYLLQRRRLADTDAKGWADLGEFCLRNGLHREALGAFGRAADIDPAQRAALEPRMEEVRAADAKAMFDRAAALAREEKIEEALRAYGLLLDKYPTSGPAAQAKEELKKLADLVQRQNEDRQKRLAAAQQQAQDQRAKADESAEAQRLAQTLRGVEEGQKLLAEGLDQEGKGVTGRARKAWEAAAARLEESRVALLDLHAKAKTPGVQDAAKREVANATRLLIVTYDSLGQMEAVDQSFRDAVRWFNKALALDPTDRVATDLKARIAAEQIVRRVRVGN
jgi:tetratricopeptide (TPR) repeat protein